MVRQFEEAEQVLRLQMFDHLRREESAERGVGQAREVTDDVGFGDVEPAGAAYFDHLVIEIEPPSGDAAAFEQLQELAATAADVENVAGSAKYGR